MAKHPFPNQEKKRLAEWKKADIFKKTLQKEAPKGHFVFYEGPPTANGKPGIHHIEARAFKDCIPRYKTMQGFRVERKGGWDTHGLPVEIEVEKQLGFSGKKDIEEYGIEAFNAKCKESVWKYLEEWQALTERMAYWVDLENAYVTYKPEYIESLWNVVKAFWDKGLVYKDYRVTPHCPRCSTSLSSHELSQGYKDVKDLTITAEFVVTNGSHESLNSDIRTAILAWTTTPWTLPGNVALAVGSDIKYVVIEKNDEGGEGRFRFVLAKEKLEEIFEGSEYDIVTEISGQDLVGTEYAPLYDVLRDLADEENLKKLEENGYRVHAGDFVTTEDGTGVVHTACMYGHDDFVLGNQIGLPKIHSLDLTGHYYDAVKPFAGRYVKDEELAVDIIKDLAHRSLLFSKSKHEHSYPHCWRCKTGIVYYAKDSWYVRMTDLRDELLKNNETIHWEPSHIKDGRFGEWLREVKDWAFSRERFWGTPLPIWECNSCDARECIGSYAELREKSTSKLAEPFDPHRPFVDDIELSCECGGTMKRVPDVCDVWFDSGAMPYAQWHYPFENSDRFESGEIYPADYISEAIDQTRGWFYTLLAVSTALGNGAPYRNVICLGHLLDANGKKMSKSLGNIVDPNEMMESYGADAVRWYMYTITQPGESKRFDEKILDEMTRKVFAILTNVRSFYDLYKDVGEMSEPSAHVLDKWILAKLHALIAYTTEHMDSYKITEPVREIGEFITELSTWYVRRSRDRFKDGGEDAMYAVATLKTVLTELSKLMAPFAPFFAEELYLSVSGEKESVHLEDWPNGPHEWENAEIIKHMQLTRQLVTLGLEARETEKVNVRQPLGSITIHGMEALNDELIDVAKDELNIKKIVFESGEELSADLDTTLTPELIREGVIREMIRRTNSMRKNADLTIEDRIVLSVASDSKEVTKAIEEHKDDLLQSVLADDVQIEDSADESYEVQGITFSISIEKVM